MLVRYASLSLQRGGVLVSQLMVLEPLELCVLEGVKNAVTVFNNVLKLI